MKKQLKFAILGLGIGLSASVSAVNFNLCEYWQEECNNGSPFACTRYEYNC